MRKLFVRPLSGELVGDGGKGYMTEATIHKIFDSFISSVRLTKVKGPPKCGVIVKTEYDDFYEAMRRKYGDRLYAKMTDAELSKLDKLELAYKKIIPKIHAPIKIDPNLAPEAIRNRWTLTEADKKKLGPRVLKLTKRGVDPYDIIPLHEAHNISYYKSLARSMKKEGWKGRPLLVMNTPQGIEALTGSHRLAAARKVGIRVPTYTVDSNLVERYAIKHKLTLDDIISGRDDDRYVRFLKIGDRGAARLTNLELK